MSIKEELKDAVKARIRAAGYGRGAAQTQIALAAIDTYFEKLEEVEVGVVNERQSIEYWRPPGNKYRSGCRSFKTVLVRKQQVPVKLEVTRETLAALTRHYADTPGKTDEGDSAAKEAARLLDQ